MRKLFRNDYSELAHINVIKALEQACNEQNVGYGLDVHSEHAENMIKEIFDCKNAEVHFLVGGTQANMTVISYLLRDYEGVLAATTGHINVHETAAVEGSGHKIVTVDGVNGKVTKEAILKQLKINNNEHTVKIKMVYISNATECGTVYNKKELEELHQVCKENDLYLFMDGARLGAALTSEENDIDVTDIAKYTDAFYIGGTKNGLMIGEAVVLVHPDFHKYFRHQIKNKGAMLAKGFFVGIEFETIMKDNLYFELAKNANKMAQILKEGLLELGYQVAPSPTNQIFVTLDKKKAALLMDEFGCEEWTDLGNQLTIRFVASFNTKIDDVNNVLAYCAKIK